MGTRVPYKVMRYFVAANRAVEITDRASAVASAADYLPLRSGVLAAVRPQRLSRTSLLNTMHMHKMFMKMYKKHGGLPSTGMHHGKHGFGAYKLGHKMGHHKLGQKLQKMGLHKTHPLMAHRMHHGIHGKHHHMKHHRRSSSSSSSCSSDCEDEFLAHEHHGKDITESSSPPLDHNHKKPFHEMFLKHKGHGRPHHKLHNMHEIVNHLQKPGDVSPYMKFKHHGPFHMKHKMGHHKMHSGKFHKMLEMRHRMTHHKLGPMGHHMMRRNKETRIHGFHHHKMFKNHHHMNHRGHSI